MSIRVKLTGLVLMVCAASFASLLARAIITAPVATIENEEELLGELAEAMLAYANEVNRIDSEGFQHQLEEIGAARAEMEEAFAGIAKAEILPTINDTVESAFNSLMGFAGDIESGSESFTRRAEELENAAAEILGNEASFTLLDLQSTERSGGRDRIRPLIVALHSSAYTVDTTVSSALENLATQRTLIEREIKAMETRANRSVFLVVLAVFVGSAGAGILFTNRIGRRVQDIEIGIQKMKEGDLADRITITSRDELGRLSGDVNVFTEELGRSMSRIKHASGTNTMVKEQLVARVSEATTMVDRVNQEAGSIESEMHDLNKTVLSSAKSSESVEGHVTRLRDVLSEQVSMIEEATSSITEMISSVTNVGTITRKKREAMGSLAKVAQEGLAKMETTARIVRLVHDSVDEIHEAASVINDMADRTNLLAMNAAIEAAHAGESGKGFAVVAGEIRKLAEASSSNSSRIDTVLSGIIDNIESAAGAGEETRGAFQRVNGEVSEALAAFKEIAGSTEELQTGGEQILQALSSLNSVSGDVTASSNAMSRSVEENRAVIQNVTATSRSVLERVSGILDSSEGMRTALTQVGDATKRLNTTAEALSTEVSYFKIGLTEEEAPPLLG